MKRTQFFELVWDIDFFKEAVEKKQFCELVNKTLIVYGSAVERKQFYELGQDIDSARKL